MQLEKPKPPPVADHYEYWGNPPPRLSPRCMYWQRQFAAGFRPNRFLRREGYDGAAEIYGVWIWEYLNIIRPMEYAP